MRISTTLLVLSLVAWLPVHTAKAVTIDWVTVGDPGNSCDTQPQGCFGAVAGAYRVSKYETTNAQYAEFLNAVAVTDPNALYNTSMDSSYGGITRSGSSGSYSYSATRENKPVNYVSFYDSLRFANWLHNGQPTGAQGNSTTEAGAYTITSEGIAANSITRNSGASIFLTSEDEWYKAAYYDALSNSYFDYPMGSNMLPTCAAPGAAANTANCNSAVANFTNVGSYTGSVSPYGTFDQGGNVFEWNESIITGVHRSRRGGDAFNGPTILGASVRQTAGPGSEDVNAGFRVAMIPEPSTGLLMGMGLVAMAASRRHSRGPA
jgi:formylglycine-generating enzyme required for sulfatase activity